MFSAELARRYGDRGIVSTALAPGGIKTELYRDDSFVRAIGVNYLHVVRASPKLNFIYRTYFSTT